VTSDSAGSMTSLSPEAMQGAMEGPLDLPRRRQCAVFLYRDVATRRLGAVRISRTRSNCDTFYAPESAVVYTDYPFASNVVAVQA